MLTVKQVLQHRVSLNYSWIVGAFSVKLVQILGTVCAVLEEGHIACGYSEQANARCPNIDLCTRELSHSETVHFWGLVNWCAIGAADCIVQ